MEAETITFLPIDEIRVIKQVFLVQENKDHGDHRIGYILYERGLSNEYRFVEVAEEDKDTNYRLNYPMQELFPNDEIDDLILGCVKNSYPKSFTYNHTLLCNVELENIEALKKRPLEESLITVSPNMTGVDLSKLSGRALQGFRDKLNIYSLLGRDQIQHISFFGYYDINDERIVDKLEKVKFI